MKDSLNKIGDYIESLEQRIAALEARVAELEARPAFATEEPEVEVELVMNDEEQPSVESPAVEQESIIEEPAVEEPVVEQEPEPIKEEEPEPVMEPSQESIQESVEPAPEPEPAPAMPHIPVQTSLFGAPVQDIRKAISLGDRFLFQRELFGGSAERMQKTLDTINALGSFAEAEQYVHSNFHWDHDSSSYELFISVLKRRFA
ncbi:MAG: hypothetical protein J6T32_05765 [Paludibacteraceae bacterium]|nr:hypothetical protein [Paludibacteraceae bacterium]